VAAEWWFVRERRNSVAKNARRLLPIIADGLKTVLTEALHAGLAPEEIEELVRKQLKKLGPKINTVSASPPSESTD